MVLSLVSFLTRTHPAGQETGPWTCGAFSTPHSSMALPILGSSSSLGLPEPYFQGANLSSDRLRNPPVPGALTRVSIILKLMTRSLHDFSTPDIHLPINKYQRLCYADSNKELLASSLLP